MVYHADPMVVWEYVADFSNMKQLNPTIINFDIISEKGNYDHWEYITEYTEHLSQLPFIKNNNEGHFIIKPDGNEYLILSHHKTCFFSYFCVKSDSEFRFSIDSGKTNCTELVTYECPSLLTSFCRKEVTFQRQAIKANLQQHFSRFNS
ncbi:hypothetical protein J437_LFUL018281 [Ladona fulva]|uniref:Uncharacterized protein n=1 Tax=Ladona fulva TaxID=123851 RepID=A0A8K0KP10_LADFU|nr:hypothetical protein J437_LFUL018281 [Ladona fulva]